MQYIEFLSGGHGPGLLSTSLKRSNIFELSQLTGAAFKCMYKWIAAD